MLLLVYTVIPLPLYATLLVGAGYTVLYEVLGWLRLPTRDLSTVLITLLLHTCLHILGCHILIMTQVRMRDTFMKVGQSLLVKRQLVMEKQLKEKMIHSVMPPKVRQDKSYLKILPFNTTYLCSCAVRKPKEQICNHSLASPAFAANTLSQGF